MIQNYFFRKKYVQDIYSHESINNLKQEIQKSKKEVDYLSDDYDANKINDSHPRFVRVMTQYALLKKIYKDIQEMEGFNDGI